MWVLKLKNRQTNYLFEWIAVSYFFSTQWAPTTVNSVLTDSIVAFKFDQFADLHFHTRNKKQLYWIYSCYINTNVRFHSKIYMYKWLIHVMNFHGSCSIKLDKQNLFGLQFQLRNYMYVTWIITHKVFNSFPYDVVYSIFFINERRKKE